METKLKLLQIPVMLIFGFFVTKLVTLQILHCDETSHTYSYIRTKRTISPVRGELLDRNLHLLAISNHNHRIYPTYELICHITGIANIYNEGLAGLEYQFDSLLRGHPYQRTYIVSDAGRLYPDPKANLTTLTFTPSVVLTIDLDLQHILEDELIRRVHETSAIRGWGIIVDPYTGEILAMAVYPQDGYHNPIIQEQWEPGSVFKLVPLVAYLEHYNVDYDSTFITCDTIRIGDKTFKDPVEHPPYTFKEVVWHSSNVGFIKMGCSLGSYTLYLEAKKFGFGTPTGVEFPAEAHGYLPHPSDMTPVDVATFSFGQGVSVTTLQLALAYAAIANGGYLLQPILVRGIIKNGQLHVLHRPTIIRQVTTPEIAAEVTTLLEGVFDYGTAAHAKIPGLRIAGKTGTAEKPIPGGYAKERKIFTLAAFLPLPEPELVIVISLDEAKGGEFAGTILAPLLKRIILRILSLEGYRHLWRQYAVEPAVARSE